MEWISNNSEYILLLGVVIVALSMLRLTFQRMRKIAEQDRQREVAVRAAKDAERKQQLSAVLPKSKVSSPKTRAPLIDPSGTPFAGSVQGIAAKWETEVHQLGRQIIGQIDCKMAALQAITLDANRAANRLEMLVEHLEQITQKQIEWQQHQPEMSPTVVPATGLASKAVPFTDALQELTENLKGFRSAIRQSAMFDEQSEPATILRLTEPLGATSASAASENLRSEVEMLSNYGLDPQEIARQMDISVGEVDLILQVQQKQPGRADTNLDATPP